MRDCEIARGRLLAAANLVLGEADIMRDVAESQLNMTISDHLAIRPFTKDRDCM